MDADSSAADSHGVNLRRVFQWIKACEATHGSVCNTRNSEHMSQNLQNLNLVDVETLSLVTRNASTKFVALSYVWGSVPMFKTQTSTLDLIRSPGSLSAQIQTFLSPPRFAMQFTSPINWAIDTYGLIACALCRIRSRFRMRSKPWQQYMPVPS